MCINQSVGHLGANHMADVKMIQTMLNLNRGRYKTAKPSALKVDGLIGKKTIDSIRKFELKILKMDESDGLVTDNDPTMIALKSGMSKSAEVDKKKLIAFMPHALEGNIDRYRKHLRTLMPKYGIKKDLQVVHFLAQLAHESGSFRYSEELASGEAYEGRTDLGNIKRGDGKRFKGRGLIQLTGRDNYEKYSSATGFDYLLKPSLVASDAKVSVDVACWFWKTKNLNKLADQDDVRAVTKRINGGFNGIDDRTAFLKRAKCLMGM